MLVAKLMLQLRMFTILPKIYATQAGWARQDEAQARVKRARGSEPMGLMLSAYLG